MGAGGRGEDETTKRRNDESGEGGREPKETREPKGPGAANERCHLSTFQLFNLSTVCLQGGRGMG